MKNQESTRIGAMDRKKTVIYIRDHRKSQELSGEEGYWTGWFLCMVGQKSMS